MIQWSPGVTLAQVEEQVIKHALQHFRGNKSQTAIALGISVKTIDNKMEKYNAAELELKAKDEERKKQAHEKFLRERGLAPTHRITNYPMG